MEGDHNMDLIEMRDVKKHFPIYSGILPKVVGHIKAVDGISLSIEQNEVLGLIGESGCGKTTLGKVALRLLDPSEGSIFFEGIDIAKKKHDDLLSFKKKTQIIFQDAHSSLDPRSSIGLSVEEPLRTHKMFQDRAKRKERVVELLEEVGLESEHCDRYPHEFSGGQKQRICIARALALDPKFVVADEPVSSLDVSVRAQILNLLKDLQAKYHLSILYISHDISGVKYISNRVAIMYLGKIVELADQNEIFKNPCHPYTKVLLSSVPVPDPETREEVKLLKGEVPSPIDPPKACRFHPRCDCCTPECKEREPELRRIKKGHFVRCLSFKDLG
ncbi:MAG: ABC transporter ATP-binding protein [Theionarchaea archaeon]|nr:ABC transporter ATP-binding protein [Theionarchaea archaeon]